MSKPPEGPPPARGKGSLESNAEVRPSGSASGIRASQEWGQQRSAPRHRELCLRTEGAHLQQAHTPVKGPGAAKQRPQGQELRWRGQTYLLPICRNVQPPQAAAQLHSLGGDAAVSLTSFPAQRAQPPQRFFQPSHCSSVGCQG